MSPSTVLPDPQYTTQTVMRPQAAYASIYGGNSIAFPLYWYPDGQPLDKQAGNDGFDANLIRGLQVSPGSTLQVWFPNVNFVDTQADPDVFYGYQWFFVWRLRNIRDFRSQSPRIPYHLSRSRGVIDTSPTPDEARTLIPAAYQSIIFNQQPASSTTEPNGPRAVNQLRGEDMVVAAQKLRGPLLTAGGTEGAVQQGVYNPASVADALRPAWLKYEVKVPAADEVILGCYRTAASANWNFGSGGSDEALSTFLNGSDALGVYILRGVDTGMSGQPRTDIGLP